jgi:hypothetical protein
MTILEENPKNPTISDVKEKPSENYFILKYKNENDRKYMVENILKIVRKHEIYDFHIEEKKAYKENRIIYNYHTLVFGIDWDFDQLEKEFLKYFN